MKSMEEYNTMLKNILEGDEAQRTTGVSALQGEINLIFQEHEKLQQEKESISNERDIYRNRVNELFLENSRQATTNLEDNNVSGDNTNLFDNLKNIADLKW